MIIHQHLDATLTLTIAGHRVGYYSAEGKLLTPLTQEQIKAVEKTLNGKVTKQTFALNLQIPHDYARIRTFPPPLRLTINQTGHLHLLPKADIFTC